MLNRDLFVILGAGASHAASTDALGARPPLVAELFDSRFDSILNDYPMARNAAPDIRDAIAGARGEPAVSLEEHLRQHYLESDDDYDRRRFFSVVAYLQHVLFHTSHRPDVHFDNLDRLCNALLRAFRRVIFVSLNYDITLDRCLAQFSPLESMGSFVSDPRWALVKLHGSITWGRRIVEPFPLFDPPADTEDRLEGELIHHWAPQLDQMRIGQVEGSTFQMFPALSAPLGEDDEITCPEPHQRFLEECLEEAEKVDLLVVGYSGLDRAVRQKFWPARGKISSLSIVDQDLPAAQRVFGRIQEELGIPHGYDGVYLAETGFASWAQGEIANWPSYVERIDGSGLLAGTW